jgi:small subunit ribosomal protein S1
LETLVLNIDKENKKFALGLRQLSDDPFASLMRNYPIGKEVTGKVTKVDDTGISLEVVEGILAFLPSAETGVKKTEVKSHFNVGDSVSAQIKKYDDKERKMIVSVKMLTKRQEKENMKDFLEKQGDASVTLKDIMKA